jgi:large subunit ribosomal protein L9
MKVILKQDIASLGKEGDIADVARGYARNYLLPKGLVAEASKSNLKQLEQKSKALEKKEAERKVLAEKEAKKLEGKTVSMQAKAGSGGKLYGSVTSKDIASAVKEQLKVEVDRRLIQLEESLKNLGQVAISIKLHPEVEVSINVDVQPSEETEVKDEDQEKKQEKEEKKE